VYLSDRVTWGFGCNKVPYCDWDLLKFVYKPSGAELNSRVGFVRFPAIAGSTKQLLVTLWLPSSLYFLVYDLHVLQLQLYTYGSQPLLYTAV
jgi:hypothetical protein